MVRKLAVKASVAVSWYVVQQWGKWKRFQRDVQRELTRREWDVRFARSRAETASILERLHDDAVRLNDPRPKEPAA
jgi:hypothetical protein